MIIGATELSMGAAAAGYVVGHGLDYAAARWSTRNDAAELTQFEEVVEYMAVHAPEQIEPEATTAQRIGRFVTRPLPLVAAATAGLNVYAYAPHAQETIAPNLEVVVDHSGGTAIAEKNQEPAANKINMVVKLLDDSERFAGKAIVAQSGQETPMRLTSVLANEPFGAARMDVALSQALSAATNEQSAQLDVRGRPSSAVVVLTDGAAIGKPDVVKGAAQQKVGAFEVATPVFVINSDAKVDPSIKKDLQTIAKDTGGKYWDINTKDNIPAHIADQLSDGTNPEEQKPSKLVEKSLGGVLLLGLVSLGLKRREYLVARGLKFNVDKKEQ